MSHRARGARRPNINPRCGADSYHGPNERIAEFYTPNGEGGLIRIQQTDDGRVLVEVYNVTAGVIVRAPNPAR